MVEQHQKTCTLSDAVEIKYGYSYAAREINGKGHNRYAGRLKSLSSTVVYQPWFGFAYREGKIKYWPKEDVEIWAQVWNHNRGQYAYDLLRDKREEVREGVREQLIKLAKQGRLHGRVLEVIKSELGAPV